jgi:hypothetical protein
MPNKSLLKQGGMTALAPMFPRIRLSSRYLAALSALVTVGEVVAVGTPDGEETDRMGAYVVNAMANA